MMDSHPIAGELVLVGGGHSHVILLRMLGMNPIPGLKVTLVNPDSRTPYSGMLPGYIAGHYTEEQIHIDLVPLCRFAGAALVLDTVVGLDPVTQTLECTTRPGIRYDVLSLDVGIKPSPNDLPDSPQIIPVKPISRFLAGWRSFVDDHPVTNATTGPATTSPRNGRQQIGFVGAGAGGVELCLAVAHYLTGNVASTDRLATKALRSQLHLFTDQATILPGFNAGVRRKFESLLASRGIVIHRDWTVVDYRDDALVSDSGRCVDIDRVFWVTHAAAQSWLAESGLQVDDGGFVRVRDTLQTEQFDTIFAVGDCATIINHPRPKSGVYAVRQGKPLHDNIRAFLLNTASSGHSPAGHARRRFLTRNRLRPYRPQLHFLSLVSTGEQHAIAVRNGFSVGGRWVWRWKHWIDTRFMNRFLHLPRMRPPPPVNTLVSGFDAQMRCGGCGSKVSSDLLNEVLTTLIGTDAPGDDAAIYPVPPGKLLLQSIDHFRGFYDDPYTIARIAVNHALSDIYACGGEPVTALAQLTLPFAKPDVTRGLLQQLMAGTLAQLDADRVKLIGGHTSEGVEMSLGFAVSGLVDEQAVWRKTGLRPGDAVILTKPLGTGVIFAADMQYRAKGHWVTGALMQMLQSNRVAADVIHQYPVSACTDITGFGLAGHALEMLRGTESGLDLHASALPVLDGAIECLVNLGITSTLHEANRRAAIQVCGVDDAQLTANEIIFDPQTSGGLLVGMAPARARACVIDLRRAGCQFAEMIGVVTDAPGLNII